MEKLEIIGKWDLLGKFFTIYGTLENPLFLAKEISDIIEHSNPRMMLQMVDTDEKQCVNNPYALKGQQEQWFLTENGLYEVLMQSRKPIAKEFKKRVKEILQTIRKTGSYALPKEQPLSTCLEDLIIQQATLLKELRLKLDAQEKRIEEIGRRPISCFPKFQSCEMWLRSKGLSRERSFIWIFSRCCAKYSREHNIAIRETGKRGYSINAYREDVLESCFKCDLKLAAPLRKPVDLADILIMAFDEFPKEIRESMLNCFPQWCFAIPDKFKTAVWRALYTSVSREPIRKIG